MGACIKTRNFSKLWGAGPRVEGSVFGGKVRDSDIRVDYFKLERGGTQKPFQVTMKVPWSLKGSRESEGQKGISKKKPGVTIVTKDIGFLMCFLRGKKLKRQGQLGPNKEGTGREKGW